MRKELELYIHIPFCVKKCAYCDFLSGPACEETIDRYVDALIGEIRQYELMAQFQNVVTIFFGGGTPSILSGEQMKRIFAALREVFHISKKAEITMEANPGTVTKEKLEAYKEAGINRISFGLQSVNNEELKQLGRIHTFEQFLESYRLAREAGFDNINVDLISAIPKQTVKSWEHTLKTIIDLKPEHISAYSLIIEEGTPFYDLYKEGGEKEEDLPSEEEERLIYEKTEEWLKEAGYHRYEISNYSKEGYECRHNLGYWDRKPYLGIGLGSSSFFTHYRYCNTSDLECYLAHSKELPVIQTGKEDLTEEEQMEEFVFLGLRKTKGVSFAKFYKDFGKTFDDCYGENKRRLEDQGLLEEEGDLLRLTKKGIDISNYVFAELLYIEEEM